MAELARFGLDDGAWAVVELQDVDPGLRLASTGRGGVMDAGSFEEALRAVAHVANAALAQFRDMPARPDEVGMEFGVRLNAEAGAVIAGNSDEGHLHVRLVWHRAAAPMEDLPLSRDCLPAPSTDRLPLPRDARHQHPHEHGHGRPLGWEPLPCPASVTSTADDRTEMIWT